MSKAYVIGHKSPDLDSVVSAISYSNFKNKLHNTEECEPAVAGDINKVTGFILEKFGFKKPEIFSAAGGEKMILVDHNEASQRVDGSDNVEITEIVDHHKMDFSCESPIEITVKPWGSTNTILYKMYKDNNIEIEKNLAGLMLSAVLDDTVITKSPTCTDIDRKTIEELAGLAGVDDWKAFGMEMFKVKASVSDFSEEQIIHNDYKDFEFKAGKFGVGQIETVDPGEFQERKEALLSEIGKIKKEGGYHSVILFITDIMREGSLFLAASDDMDALSEVFGTKFENNEAYIDGIMSRKKQVVPKLTEAFDK